MAKGQISKSLIFKKIIDTFEGSFPYNDGKEIRINMEEDGELVQIKITLTAAKTPVEPGSDNAIPTAANVVNNNEITNSVINQVSNVEPTIVEPTEEEKQNLQNMLSKLGL